MMEEAKRKTKIAIVGGGCGALTAAFVLSQPTQGESPFEVTVYQMGWRLGGKGASGRNAKLHGRTEEHGLHVWMGFYENAFYLIRKCYAELAQQYAGDTTKAQSPFTRWDDAFFPDHWVGVADESRNAWRTWSSFIPARPGLPGDPLDADTNPFTLQSYLMHSCDLLRALLRSSFADAKQAQTDVPDLSAFTPRKLVDKVTDVLRTGVLTGASAIYEAASILKVVLGGRFELPGGDYTVLKYAEAIAANVQAQAESVFASDAELGPKLELVELVTTVIVGILRDGLLSDPEGLDAINDEDCRVWLSRHGASERATGSPLVRALYDMAFAEVKASKDDRPGLAAGQALRGALRMFFTYRGALFWKMRAGMGDAVFSPLYEVLKLRGVKFEFFHELTDVRTSKPDATESQGQSPAPEADPDAMRVTELHFRVQAEPKTRVSGSGVSRLEQQALDDGEYYPLDAEGCWPSEAIHGRLAQTYVEDFERPSERSANGELPSGAKTKVLTEADFDAVVLGVSVAALPYACPHLLETDPRWQDMVERLPTIPTQSLQLWLRDGVETYCSSPTPTTVSGFAKPFDTWSDMSQLLALETWPDPQPKGLVYFCGALPLQEEALEQRDQAKRKAEQARRQAALATQQAEAAADEAELKHFIDQRRRDLDLAKEHLAKAAEPVPYMDEQQAYDAAIEYLDGALPRLWPNIGNPKRPGFRWDVLVGSDAAGSLRRPTHEQKTALLRGQYLTVNVHPSDRYVLTRPGTMQYRISPLDTGYENLTIAGDWTDCGFNEGCVEAAVMSGLLAAHAICGAPELEMIIGFDHP